MFPPRREPQSARTGESETATFFMTFWHVFQGPLFCMFLLSFLSLWDKFWEQSGRHFGVVLAMKIKLAKKEGCGEFDENDYQVKCLPRGAL